jgi:hypothetical protein
MITAEDYNVEGAIRLGVKCMEQMTEEYLSKHSDRDLKSYRTFLKNQLTYNHWLRSIVDPDEILDCMERVRQEKLRTDEEYKAQWYETEK